MPPYQSRSRNSGVIAFNLAENSIELEFRDGSRYLYNATQPGPKAVATMQQLALAGAGLTTFVNRHVRDRYAAKLPRNPLRSEPTRTQPAPTPDPAQSDPETPL